MHVLCRDTYEQWVRCVINKVEVFYVSIYLLLLIRFGFYSLLCSFLYFFGASFTVSKSNSGGDSSKQQLKCYFTDLPTKIKNVLDKEAICYFL